MAYEKRVAVLKQVNKGFTADGNALTGAVYCERLGSEISVTVRAAGLAALKEGRYAVVLFVQDKRYCFDLGGGEAMKITDAPTIKEGFSVLIAYVREGAQPVAFGRCGNAAWEVKELLNFLTVGEKKKDSPPAIPVPPIEFPLIAPNSPRAPGVPLPDPPSKEETEDRASFRERAYAYDDEAIAESDYFYDCIQAGDRNEAAAGKDERKRRKAAGGDDIKKNDNAVNPFLRTEGSLTYYKKIEGALKRAFEKFKPDTRLLSVFPCSEWVKTKDALLGTVYENGRPRYLCVAVEKTGEPPEEMREHCTFVPQSPFSDDKGFYIVFQDADTGAYVKTENA